MKKTKISLFVSLVALAAALVVSPASHADTTPGWYVSAGVGAMFPNDPTVHANVLPTKITGTNKGVDSDWLASIGWAYRWGGRLEVEYMYNQLNMKNLAGLPGQGHQINNLLMLNALYDFQTGSMFTPYIGGGVGPNFVYINNAGFAGGPYLRGAATVLAYQAILGLNFDITRNWALGLDYRYISWLDPKVGWTGGSGGRLGNDSNNIMLTARYTFAPPPAPMREVQAPMVPQRAPIPPQVAPIEQNYTVFFDFDRSVLTPEARRIIASAVQEFQRGGYATITVTGHTDTVGTQAYNLKLSQRRAASVKAELIKLGVGGANIRTMGVGKEDLLVPTTNGVREAQNRRAVIVISR